MHILIQCKIFNKKKQSNDEKPLITKARSKSDGIVFFSNRIPIAIDTFIKNDEIQSFRLYPQRKGYFEAGDNPDCQYQGRRESR